VYFHRPFLLISSVSISLIMTTQTSSAATRTLLSIACIGAAALAAWIWKDHPEQAPPSHESSGIALGKNAPEHILDALPVADIASPTGKLLASAIQKTRNAPDKPGHWVMVGDVIAQVQRDTGDTKCYAHAESVYQEALRLSPQTLDALTGMAWVTGGRHLFDQSIDWAKRALAVDENSVFAYGILGDAELELGQYDAAMDHYQRMMDLRPDLSSWSRGAHLLWIMGDKSKAMWLMEKAINAGAPFAENTAWCRAKLANMLFHDGALLPAQKIIQPALEGGTKNVHIQLVAARIAAAQLDYPRARAHYLSLLKSAPNLEALIGLSDVAQAQGQAAESRAYDQQVVELHGKHLQSGVHDHGIMAKFYADRDRDLVAALRMAEEHKLTNNVLEADTLAWVYFKNGDLPKAVTTMKRALKYNTPDAELHYHAGMIAAAFGDTTSAKKHLQTALSYNPNFNPRNAPLAQQALDRLVNRSAVGQATTEVTSETP
jgi:tetratricopeptide (TPR) repeat protein